MAVRPIRLFPDDILSTPCQPVTSFDKELVQLVTNLWETLQDSPGVGLAAPQIGVSRRVSVIDIGRVYYRKRLDSSYSGSFVIINPTIVDGKGTQVPREGCLSVPD